MASQGVDLAAQHLSAVFIGGRISSFFNRNEEGIRSGELPEEGIERLKVLSPGFAKIVCEHQLTVGECRQSAQQAAELADESPLSATHYQQTGQGLFERKLV